MTKEQLLDDFKNFLVKTTKHYELPEAIQKGDTKQIFRAPEIYKMRLPDSNDAKKKAPYIIAQYVTGKDFHRQLQQSQSTAIVRLVFCVYNKDEQEGALSLLNVMETVRMELMKQVLIGKCFKLDTDAGVESLVYPEDTAPYYAGEMMLTVFVPPTEREVNYG
ncbi:MAG: hypothetical protein IJV73_02445 [Clostridia bacterium]|nr:hypothetical protein [Clostridia bacterium]